MKRTVQRVRYFSMFSGIGGFELGIEQAAKELGLTSECVGYSEIDKPAIKLARLRLVETAAGTTAE